MNKIFIGDGIFDKLSSREVVQCVWDSTSSKQKNIHEQCAKGVDSILKEAIMKKTIDNITVVVIGFSNFKKKIFPRAPKENDEKNLSKINNSIDTNFNMATNHTSTDYSTLLPAETKKNVVFNNNNNYNNNNHTILNNRQIPEETTEKNERNLHLALERTVKNPFNPFLNSPLTKSKPEYINNFKMTPTTTFSNNPLLNLKTSKAEALKKNDREKTYEDKGWEIKKDMLNGKITINK